MIIKQQDRVEIERYGSPTESTNMEISQDDLPKLMDFLSENIYRDYEGSTVRETVSNAWDSTIISEKKEPILVCINKTLQGNWEYTVEDFGGGLDKNTIETVIKKYLKSTKENCSKQLGQKGVGFKSPLSYNSSFLFIARKDGIEQTCMMYKAEEGNKIDYLVTKPTTEKNGVKIIVPIKDRYDAQTFSNKIREQLSYFSNIYVKDDYNYFDNNAKIYQNDLFKWSEVQKDRNMHICLEQVYYPIDYKKLGIDEIQVPIAINVGLEDGLIPTLSREDITYTPFAKKFLLDKIKEISTWFCEQYNNQTKEYESLLKAWEFINDDAKYVKVGDKSFEITELEQYSTIKCKELSIKGISILPPKKYRRMFSELTRDFTASGYIYNSRMKTAKHFNAYILGKKTVVINHNLTGFFREYLKEEGYKYILRDGYATKENLKWYKANILNDIPKEKWRDAIKEYQAVKKKFIGQSIIDGRKLHLSEDFLEFVKDNKKTRSYSSNYVSKALNKQKGEVTIGWIKPTYYENGYKVDKTVYSQEQLNFHFSTILFLEEDKEIGKELYSVFKYNKNKKGQNTYRFAVIGKNEYKKLPKNKKFMLYAKSSKDVRDIKLFRKAATALLFQKEINRWNEITSDGKKIVEQVLLPLYEKVQKVREYANANHYRMSEEVSEMLYQKAEETKDWDYTLWKEYTEVKNALDELDCLKYFSKPNGVSQEDYVKFINELLLTRKLSGKFKMDSFSICINDVVTVPEEQLELQFQEENI